MCAKSGAAKKKKIVFGAIAVVVAVALALGLGLGFGLKDSDDSRTSTGNSNGEATSSRDATSSSSKETTLRPTTTHEPASTAHYPTTSHSPSHQIPQCRPGYRVVDNDHGVYSCAQGEYPSTPKDGIQTMDPNWRQPVCVAKPDVPVAVIQAAYDFTIKNFESGGAHDAIDRTGIFSKQTIYMKSYIFQDYHPRQQCNIRGYVNGKGTWVIDKRYPNIAHFSLRAGPMKMPYHTRRPINQNICKVGSVCCIPKPLSFTNKYFSWFKFGVDFQRVCSPLYLKSCKGYDNCANAQTNREKSACNCMECNKPRCGEWTGAGVDCWDILPGGGGLFGKYDMIESFAWAMQKRFEHTKECSQPYDRDDMVQKCNNTYHGACMIDYVPGLKTDYSIMNYGGHI